MEKVIYKMQVKIKVPKKGFPENEEWRDVKTSDGKTYFYDSREKAEKMLKMCYGDALPSDKMRVI